MTKQAQVFPRLNPTELIWLKKLGFTAVVMVNRPISAREPGSVESAHRSRGDANKFATHLNKTYGCRDGYRGVTL